MSTDTATKFKKAITVCYMDGASTVAVGEESVGAFYTEGDVRLSLPASFLVVEQRDVRALQIKCGAGYVPTRVRGWAACALPAWARPAVDHDLEAQRQEEQADVDAGDRVDERIAADAALGSDEGGSAS